MVTEAIPVLERLHPAERQESEMRALYAIAQILVNRAGQRQMLLEVLGVLDEQLGLARGTVMLLSPDATELTVEAAVPHQDRPEQEARYQRGEGIIGKVLATGRPIVVPCIAREPQFSHRLYQRAGDMLERTSFICVPIALGSEVVGTLSVDTPYRQEDALQRAERVLSIVAGMIAHDVKSRRVARLERASLEAENLRLRSTLGEQFRPETMIGNSTQMQQVYTRIHQVAGSDTPIMLRGEAGTGKGLVAAAIHYRSGRADRPFVKVSCAALNDTLLESELFGHEAGAFPGAVQAAPGHIEEAHGGTIFFDEIADLPASMQAKLLRLLQDREFARMGSNRVHKADVRIIAGSNRDLEAAVRAGEFRQDLYYRLNVFMLHLPPLRDRRDDVLLLADHFVKLYAQQLGKPMRRITTSAINMLFAYHWPGNVRELENCIQQAVMVSEDGVVHGHHLPPTLQTPNEEELPGDWSLRTKVQVMERDMIIDALKHTRGNVTAAARELGITPRMVRYKIMKLDIEFERLFRRRRAR